VKDLCAAWDRKFTSRFGAPRFKKKGAGDTIRFPQDCAYDAAAGVVRLPKLGDVRLRHSRPALGQLKNVTLRFEGKRLVVSLQTERQIDVPAPTGTGEVGLNFGAVATITPSAGAAIELPARIGRYERRMKRLQRAVSRKRKVRTIAVRPRRAWPSATGASGPFGAISCTKQRRSSFRVMR
jgi:putative transposase